MTTATQKAFAAQLGSNAGVSNATWSLSASGRASVSAGDANLVKPGAKAAAGSPMMDWSSWGSVGSMIGDPGGTPSWAGSPIGCSFWRCLSFIRSTRSYPLFTERPPHIVPRFGFRPWSMQSGSLAEPNSTAWRKPACVAHMSSGCWACACYRSRRDMRLGGRMRMDL